MHKDFVVKDGDDECGTVTVTLVDEKSDAEEKKKGDPGSMVFEFRAAKKEAEKKSEAGRGEKKEPKNECCGDGGAGWIQHVRASAIQDWSYDNGTINPNKGGDSNPDSKHQPTQPSDKGYTTIP